MSKDRPNILLITTDQQRFDALGCNGSDFLKTPNLDRLAVQGVNFKRAYCPAAVCTPSRVSIMTGQHLSRHGSYNIGVQPTSIDRFLSTVLSASGYWTAHIGKGHWYPFGTPGSPEEMKQDIANFQTAWLDFAGFDHAELAIGHTLYGTFGHYGTWLRQKGADPDTLAPKYLFNEDLNDTADWDLPKDLHSGQWTVERALELITSREGNQPFFMHLGFEDPHHPHALPADFQNRVDPSELPDPLPEGEPVDGAPHIELFRDDGLQESRFRGSFEVAGQGRTSWRAYFADAEKSKATRAYYYSMIQLMDEQIGRLLDGLEAAGLRENTLIVFTSDHGEMLGDHGIGQKGPLAFEAVLKVPLLMSGPGVPKGQMCDDVVSLVDLYPTFLKQAGLQVDQASEGEDLFERVVGGISKRDGVRAEYKEEPDRIRYKAWIEKDWKLVIYGGEDFGELYHLAEDPNEYVNLFNHPDWMAMRMILTQRLLADMEKGEPVNFRGSRA